MCKKFTIGAILLGVVVLFAGSPLLRSYVKSAWHQTVCKMKGNIPAEFEIERLKGEIAQLDQEVPQLVTALAEMSYDLDNQKKQLQTVQGKLKAHTERLVDFAKAVKNNPNTQFVFAKQSFAPTEANKKLADEYKTFNTMKTIAEGKEKLVAAREKQFKIKLDQVNRIRQQKQEFELQLTNLETELALVKHQPGTPEKAFDNSRITLIEEGLKNLTRQVGIAKKESELKIMLGTGTDNAGPAAGPQIDPDVVLNAIQNPATEPKNDTETTQGDQ